MSQTLHKKLIKSGNGVDKPNKGDEVTIQYTGWLYDASATDNQNRGKEWVVQKAFLST
jgi:FK506-binding protein 1